MSTHGDGEPVRPMDTRKLSRKEVARGWTHALGSTLAAPLMPLWWLVSKVLRRPQAERMLMFHPYPRFVVSLPLIVIGAVTAGLFHLRANWPGHLGWIAPELLGWIYWLTVFVTCVAWGFNVGRTAFYFLVSTIVIVVLACGWIQSARDVAIWSNVRWFFRAFHVSLDPGGPLLLSFCLLVVFFGMAVWQRFNDEWRQMGNHLEHTRQLKTDYSMNCIGKTVVEDYPCLLKRWLCLGYGNIIIMDSEGKRVVRLIEGVLFCRRRTRIIRKHLSLVDMKVSDVAILDEQAQAAAAEAAGAVADEHAASQLGD
jgi:hypothetical protein